MIIGLGKVSIFSYKFVPCFLSRAYIYIYIYVRGVQYNQLHTKDLSSHAVLR